MSQTLPVKILYKYVAQASNVICRQLDCREQGTAPL